jgi:hypothetical protein
MAGSYAFSPIGFSGTVAGGGDTENSRYSTALKYRVAIGDFRAAALWQFGGYDKSNGSNSAFGAEPGGDFRLGLGTLSLDAIGSDNKDAVNLTLSGASTNAAGVPIGMMLPQTVTATLSDNTNVMLLAKYTVEKLKLYAGYEWMQFAPPGDPFTVDDRSRFAPKWDTYVGPSTPRLTADPPTVTSRATTSPRRPGFASASDAVSMSVVAGGARVGVIARLMRRSLSVSSSILQLNQQYGFYPAYCT